MASFSDDPRILGNFPGYVETLPAETLAQVGMIKQEQFDRGVEKVQSQVNMLSSLPIAKEEVKSYVQTKLGQLREGVTKNLAGDFSDSRITNQIGGAARIIARDPIVQNGVTSTARMSTAQAEMQKAKEAGKSAPQNEAYLQQSIGAWLNDGQLDSPFSGSYVPHTDYIDKLTKTFKDMNPGQDIPRDAYSFDPKAITPENPEGRVVNPTLFKGIGPKRIQDAWDLVISQPDVQNQLKIDGWYRYNGVTPNELGRSLANSTNKVKQDIKAAIDALQAKITMGSTDPSLSAQIEQYKQMDVERTKAYENINSILHGKNPESAKTELVKDQIINDFIGAHAFQVMEKSPLWETSMQERVFQRQQDQWQKDYDLSVSKYKLDVFKAQADADEKAAKAAKEAPGGKDVITHEKIESDEISTGSAKQYEDVQSSLELYNQAVFDLANRMAGGTGSPTAFNNVTNQWELNMDNIGEGKKYKNKQEAMDAISTFLGQAKDGRNNGKVVDDGIKDLVDRSDNRWDAYQSKSQVITEVESKYKDVLKIAGLDANNDFAKLVIVNKKLPGWQGVESGLISKYGDNYQEAMEVVHPIHGAEGAYDEEPLKNYGKYKELENLVTKNSDVSLALKQREEEFSRRQSTSIPLTVTHDVTESKAREEINTRFFALAKARAVNPSTGKGDASNIMEETGKGLDKRKQLQYTSRFDPQTKKAYIQIWDGTSSDETEVDAGEYFRQFPERRYNNDFREKYGPRLELTKWQSTDPLGGVEGGFNNALPINMSDPKYPYAVKYHLTVQGKDQYAMKLYIRPIPTTDNPNPPPIVNGEYAPVTIVGMPSTLTEEQVMVWTERLKDATFLNQFLLNRFRPQQ